MAGIRAAKRYAQGLIQFANESNQAEKVNQEMIDLKKSIEGSRELSVFLASPILDTKKKNIIGAELFKDFSQVTKNFIQLVINQGRGDILGQITEQYTHLYNRQNNISVAEIISAVELDEAMIQEIVSSAKNTLGSDNTFEIDSKVDPDLLGGFILRVGDKQIDSSVRSKLNRLKKEFDKNEYIPKI